MDEVQLQVVDKDGKYRGGLFRLGRGDHVWRGKSKANPAESMVCLGTVESGEWFLLELVHRESASEDDENDILVSASRACRRMPVQALSWFMKQDIGAPPALSMRVERFHRDWLKFCDSASARSLLEEILRRRNVPESDALLSGGSSDLELLVRLELLRTESSGGSTFYMADSVVKDMGIAGFAAWVNDHLNRVGHPMADSKPKHGTPTPAAWDAREAFHRATMAVHEDLGALVAILKEAPNLQVALLTLDSISGQSAPERGDSKWIARMKHAVGHLLESLNAVMAVRKQHPGVGSAFGCGRGIDRMWGAVGSASHHDVALGAAEAVLESATTRKGSGLIRHAVIEAVADPVAWARLAENLKHEHKSASVLPQGAPPQASVTGEAREAEITYVDSIAERWLRATWFATGGGLRGTSSSSRSTLSELTDRLLGLAAKIGHPCAALQEVGRVLADIDAADSWIDGPTWKARPMCRVCGSIKFETSGRCSKEPGGCDGEIEVLGEDEWATEAKFYRDRLMSRLSALLDRAKEEVRQLSPRAFANQSAESTAKKAPAGDNAEPGERPGVVTERSSLGFTKVEKAIALLMRDGGQRKSVRRYAKLVGVSHSTLSRSEQWQKAWSASATNPAELPMGTKDAEGRLEAWREVEFCDNCHQEPITGTATVGDELVRICETCARKLAPRTNPRTT